MSAPFAESPFAALQMLGMLACAMAWQPDTSLLSRITLTVVAGSVFGLATTFRSNGVLGGLIFVQPFFKSCSALFRSRNSRSALCHLASIGIAGLLILAGMVYPQYLAYQEYCTLPNPAEVRPWCNRRIPSIYTFVQSQYWSVS